MKTKFFKFVIPAFAIVLAVAVSAFTVKDNSLLDENDMIMGNYYLNANNPCAPISVPECDLESEKLCKYESQNVFLAGTNCSIQLKRP